MPIHKQTTSIICIFSCLLVSVMACSSANSKQGINKIIGAGHYQVSVNAWACFGNDTTVLNVVKDGVVQKAAFTFAGDNEKGGYSKKGGLVTWNAGKEKLLREFFEMGLTKKNKQTCTAEAVYTLYSGSDTVTFTDDTCEFNKQFEELLQ